MLIKQNKSTKGFTLIELLTVIAIFIILASMIIPVYGNLQASTIFNDSKDQIIQTIRNAQANSCNGKNNSSNGVYFETDGSGHAQAISFNGETYLERDEAYDERIVFEGDIKINHTFTSDEIIFYKNSCLPNQVGEISISSEIIGKNITVSVNSLGVVSE